MAGSVGRVAPHGRRHELLSLWGPSFLHWVNTSHLSSRVESHWPDEPSIELQPVACSWRMSLALNCNQDMFRLCCSGGTSNLGVDVGLWGRLSFSLHANGFEGWCSPRCFGPPAASNRCCGVGVSSLVRGSGLCGAYRPSNAHEDGRPVALKTDLACRNGPTS